MCGSGSKNMAKNGCEMHHRLQQRPPKPGSETTTAHYLQRGPTTIYRPLLHQKTGAEPRYGSRG